MTARSRATRRRRAAAAKPQATAEKQTATRPWPSWALPVALAVLHFFVLLAAYNPAPPTGGDDATYLALARSLLTTGTYRDIWDPLTPPHVQYPPVFPLILAGGLAVGLTPAFGLKMIIIVFSACAIGLSVAWMRKIAGTVISAAVGFALALSPGLATISHAVLSDVPFWAMTMLALLLWQRYQENVDAGAFVSPRDEKLDVAVAAAAIVLANFTRSAGLPLVAAAAIWVLYRRRPAALAVLLAVVLPPILLWWIRTQSAGHGGYVAPFMARNPYDPSQGTIGLSDLPERIGRNLTYYLGTGIPTSLTGRRWPGMWLGIPVAALAVSGWIRRLRKPALPEIWVVLYVGLILLWPSTWSSERFILPLLPLLLLYACQTLPWMLRPVPKAEALVPVTACAILVVLLIPDLSREFRNSAGCRAETADVTLACTDSTYAAFFHLADETRGKLPAGSVVLSRKPSIFFMRSGYRSALYPLSSDPEQFYRAADSVGANYVVVDQIPGLGPHYLHPILLARRDDFCVINELSWSNASLAQIDTSAPPRKNVTAPNSFRGCPLSQRRAPPARRP
ncbi:MAG TPA: hypothetical protein VIF83_15005 [Gemmatimonadaceae bacterium]|jgi:hypothetical protein